MADWHDGSAAHVQSPNHRAIWAEREVGTLVALRWAVGGVLPVSKLHGLPCSESRENDKNVVTVQSSKVRTFRTFLLRNIYWIHVTGMPSSGSLTPASVVITTGRLNLPTWSTFPVVAFDTIQSFRVSQFVTSSLHGLSHNCCSSTSRQTHTHMHACTHARTHTRYTHRHWVTLFSMNKHCLT